MDCKLATIFGFTFEAFRERNLMFIVSGFKCSFCWTCVNFVVIFGCWNFSLVYHIIWATLYQLGSLFLFCNYKGFLIHLIFSKVLIMWIYKGHDIWCAAIWYFYVISFKYFVVNVVFVKLPLKKLKIPFKKMSSKGFEITIDNGNTSTEFLDVSLDLLLNTYCSYRKPYSTTNYIKNHSNHPKNIRSSIPEKIKKVYVNYLKMKKFLAIS